MENLEFEDQQFQPRFQNTIPSQSGMAGWLIKKGIVKDVSTANYILLGLGILFTILTIIIFFTFIKQPSAPKDTGNTVIDPALAP